MTKGKGFSELAVERGFCKPRHIVEAVREQNRLKEEEGIQRSLKEILLERGVLSPTQVEEIETARRGAKILAGFEVLEKVGQGAMGVVFKARQIALDRIVALKVLSPKLARDASFKERFLREARFSAKLNHLNVISGIDCGEEHGYLYFAMEFVHGRTTGEMLKERGRLSVEDAVKIVRQVADALQYAHSFNLVHRDVKPDNVMVDADGTAKLCDLGLATLKRTERGERWGDRDDDNGDGDGSATKAGRVVGTPFYLSPEQAKGAENIDCRCDIYSLGATLYHYLAGRPPFEGRSREVMRQHVKSEAPSICELNAEVPVVLGQILSKMMAKDPAERYADPEELIADLDAAVEGREVTAAEFKGRSSCAMPARNLRRPPMPKPRQRPVQEVLPVLKKPRDTTKKIIPATPAAPLAPSGRNTRMLRRPRHSSGSLAGIVILALALVVAMVLYSHLSRMPVPPPAPAAPAAVRPAPTRTEPAKPAPKTAPPDSRKNEPAVPPDPQTKDALDRVVDLPDTPRTGPVETTAVADLPVQPARPAVPKEKVAGLLLLEMVKRLASGDLAQAGAVLDELAARPEFAAVKAELDAERQDWVAALAYERAALGHLAGAQPRRTVRLTEAGRRKCENKEEAAIESFDPARGVGANLGQVGITLQPWDFHPADVVRKAEGAGDPAGSVCYLLARGRVGAARKRLSQVPPEARSRLEAKVGLLAEFEKESEAAEAFEQLEKLAADRQWGALRTALGGFEQAHAGTAVAQANAARLSEWKRKAEETGVPDLSKQFGVPAEQLAGGGCAFTWTSKETDAFKADWTIDDPQGDRPGFVVWKPQMDSIVAFRGKSGEFWDGKRKGAVVVTPSRELKVGRYRLEVHYTLGVGCYGGFIAGIGVWDGGDRGVTFGPREGRGGRLSIAGSPPGLEGNFEKDRLPSAILAGRGQLGLEVEGGEWHFLSRRYEDTQEEAWREACTVKGSANVKPAIVPVTWATGKIDLIVHKVRLVILPAR